MLRSLHSSSGEAAGRLSLAPRSSQHTDDLERPGSVLERLVARLLGAHAPAVLAFPLWWLRRSRYRHELANLSDAQLRDVGLNPELVRRESTKPFWLA